MNAILDGLGAIADPTTLFCMLIGLLLGLLVGAFPGLTTTMAVALAAGFTMTLEPVQGLATMLTIYVASQYGDRVPSILVNTPGTPASIATTLDGYPMAKKGQAGLALVVSSLATTVGITFSMIVFALVARPIAGYALKFGPYELFALVVFGLTMMISISSDSVIKGIVAGVIGLVLGAVGLDPITGDARFTFNSYALADGLPFIAVIIGLFGIAEVFDQMLTDHDKKSRPISSLGRWWPNRGELRRMLKPLGIGSLVGTGVGIVPAAGGDIAGLIGWDRTRAASKEKKNFGKGQMEGLVGADTASSAVLGGALTTTMALGIPGDSVMAVMIASMIIWGIQPGPSLFAEQPSLIASITGIVVLANVVAGVVSLTRTRFMVKLLDLKPQYLWSIILIFCIVGTYATTNDISTVVVMLGAGAVGLLLKRTGIPAGPVVLGLLLGPLAERNLRRALLIDQADGFFTRPIALVLLVLAVAALVVPLIRDALRRRKGGGDEPSDGPAGEDTAALTRES